MNYGYYFNLNAQGIWLMINGRMYSLFKRCNTNKWQLSIWDNYWRKNKIAIKS